jgi:hypothetical protein
VHGTRDACVTSDSGQLEAQPNDGDYGGQEHSEIMREILGDSQST